MNDAQRTYLLKVALYKGADTPAAPVTAVAHAAEQPGVLRQILHAPLDLMGAIGHGLSGGSEAGSAAAKLLEAQGHGGATRALGSMAPAAAGAWEKFHGAGGLRAAALTGLGGLALYGGKQLYDEGRNHYHNWQYGRGAPDGYYAPGGY